MSFYLSSPTGAIIVRQQAQPPLELTPDIMRNAIIEYCNQTARDLSMTAVVAFGVQNIACHAGLMVEVPGHAAMPTGQFLNLVAGSGYGKTVTMNDFSPSLRRFADEESEIAQKALEADLNAAPAPIIFHSDSTTEEVLDSFRYQTATAIFTSEGAMMTDLQHRGPPAAYNDAHSGQGIRQLRIGRLGVNQPEAKLAILSATQPDPFVDASAKNNCAANVNGYSARCFDVMPVSRGISQAFASGDKTPHLDAYRAQTFEMLKITQREKRSFKLKMSAPSKDMFSWHRDQCAVMLASGQWTGHHQSWLLRLSEKVLRLAAQFRFAESLDGSDVDALSMHRAIAWGQWFADEHMRLFGPLGLLTREVRDAEIAWQCLLDYVTTFRNFDFLNQATIDTLCKEKLKTKPRIQKALNILVHTGQLFPHKQGKTVVFQMHPSVIDGLFGVSGFGFQAPQGQIGYSSWAQH